MTEFLTTVGNFMSSGMGKGITSLLGLAGAGTNVYTGIQQMQQAQKQASAQDYARNLVQNPAKLAAASAAYTQPLTAGLTSGIENEVQASLAERGLGYSPAAFTQTLTQALAPYILQNQQTGRSELLNSLQMMMGGNNPYGASPFANLGSILKMLQMPSSSGQGSLADVQSLGMGGPDTPPSDAPPLFDLGFTGEDYGFTGGE